MTISAPTRRPDPAKYGSQRLAGALGLSRIAFGSILAAGYVTTSVKRTGQGRPRRFTLVDAYQLGLFFRLYGHWPRSVVILGWLLDALLERDRIEFGTWPRSPAAGQRPAGLPPREAVADRIELLSGQPELLPPWYRHRDPATPFRLLVTSGALQVVHSPEAPPEDGLLVNLTRTLGALDEALARPDFPPRLSFAMAEG